MASITFAVNEELRAEIKKFFWVKWSELVRQSLLTRKIRCEELFKRLNSEEERELVKWSVELGRKAKKGRFKELLKEMSPEKREELLSSMSPEQREEYK